MISRSLKAVHKLVHEKYPASKDPKTAIKERWFTTARELTCEFIQNDAELGQIMLEYCDHYWQQYYENGLSPQDALTALIYCMQNAKWTSSRYNK
jgi:hypothetical protein